MKFRTVSDENRMISDDDKWKLLCLSTGSEGVRHFRLISANCQLDFDAVLLTEPTFEWQVYQVIATIEPHSAEDPVVPWRAKISEFFAVITQALFDFGYFFGDLTAEIPVSLKTDVIKTYISSGPGNEFFFGTGGLIIFDGSCGACSAYIAERKRFFEKHGFSVAPLQESWVSRVTGIDELTLAEAIHLVTPAGDVYRGIDVFQRVSERIWWLVPLSSMLRIKPLRPFFLGGYDFLSRRIQV